jgi:DNA polymerase III alpha subunit (gram-positive type)
MKLVVLDFETSGLDPETSEVLEVALLPWDDGKRGEVMSEKFCAIGNTTAPDFIAAAKLNGYTDDEANRKPRFTAPFVRKILDVIVAHDGVVLGSNPFFDWRFLETAARRMRVAMPDTRIRLVDTASLAVPLLLAGKVKGLSLGELTESLLNKKRSNVHSAGEDVTLTIEVFESIVGRYFKALQ